MAFDTEAQSAFDAALKTLRDAGVEVTVDDERRAREAYDDVAADLEAMRAEAEADVDYGDPDYDDDGPDLRFADPGGNSALRAATRRNPRNRRCPTCREPDRLTAEDVARNYQCDGCADRVEGRRME